MILVEGVPMAQLSDGAVGAWLLWNALKFGMIFGIIWAVEWMFSWLG